MMRYLVLLLAAAACTAPSSPPRAHSTATDPLPSWNDGPSKKTVTGFVSRVTQQGGPDFVHPSERVAVFDNDGTLWSEQPMYFQFAFALDRVRTLAPTHPEWKQSQPFRAVLEGDMKALTVLATGP